jgi:glycosyltransferase involved in cell wall biosynthesis
MIGLVTTSYPRTPDDGSGAFVRQRALALAATGVVEVVAAGDPTVAAPGVIRVPSPLFEGCGAPEALESGGGRALLQALAFTARLAGVVRERASRWDAVETHWLVPCALVGCALAGGRPHRAYSHGGDVALLERLVGGATLARALARSGASFVFASADLRDRFARLCGRSPAALPAAVEPAPFDQALFRRRTRQEQLEARQRLGCVRPLILGVGRLVPVKGFAVLVRAVARLPSGRRPRLVILGDGPERPALHARAARAGIDLHLPGAVAPTGVAAWMTAADLYVQPSVTVTSGRAEGMPVAVREALAVGLPVVASALGGMREWRDPALTLIPEADPAALARAIAAFL